MRMLRSKREFGLTRRRELSDPEPIFVAEDDRPASFTADASYSRKRTSTSVSGPNVHLNSAGPITFKRHGCCYKKETITMITPADVEKESAGGGKIGDGGAQVGTSLAFLLT
jgi:hypothetical protein